MRQVWGCVACTYLQAITWGSEEGEKKLKEKKKKKKSYLSYLEFSRKLLAKQRGEKKKKQKPFFCGAYGDTILLRKCVNAYLILS